MNRLSAKCDRSFKELSLSEKERVLLSCLPCRNGAKDVTTEEILRCASEDKYNKETDQLQGVMHHIRQMMQQLEEDSPKVPPPAISTPETKGPSPARGEHSSSDGIGIINRTPERKVGPRRIRVRRSHKRNPTKVLDTLFGAGKNHRHSPLDCLQNLIGTSSKETSTPGENKSCKHEQSAFCTRTEEAKSVGSRNAGDRSVSLVELEVRQKADANYITVSPWDSDSSRRDHLLDIIRNKRKKSSVTNTDKKSREGVREARTRFSVQVMNSSYGDPATSKAVAPTTRKWMGRKGEHRRRLSLDQPSAGLMRECCRGQD